ncbi:MAG: hypothetical protein Q9220_005115 [cf. Caloplaca sp. 1 TL-2023]
MKMSYDTLGEAAWERLQHFSPRPAEGSKTIHATEGQASPVPGRKDLFLMLRDHAQQDEVLCQLWTEVNSVPSWVCWEQIARGQEVFYRYGGPALTGLAFQSLLGGMVDETTQHILQCTKDISSIQPGGAGHASTIRVRLLHAAVRQRILKLSQEKPDYYDVEQFGVPINDLDSIATIGTFSATLIWLSFPRQGIWLRSQEIEDYIALFRYIAYLTGTPNEYFETPARAKTVMETLLRDEIRPTAKSRILANNILSCLEDQPPTFASRSFLEANCRWLNGNELCDHLGIGRPSLYYWLLMAGQVLFFMAICYTYRSIPVLDRRKIAAFRRIIWSVIVEDKQGLGEETVFEFKYIPDLSKTTRAEKSQSKGTRRGGVEKRNLRAFVLGCIVITTVLFLMFRLIKAHSEFGQVYALIPQTLNKQLGDLDILRHCAGHVNGNGMQLLAIGEVTSASEIQSTQSPRLKTLDPQYYETLGQSRSNENGRHTNDGIFLHLSRVLGNSVRSNNALCAAADTNTFAYIAGPVVVLASINSALRLDQCFFVIRADALPAQATPSYYNPATPTKAGFSHSSNSSPRKENSSLGPSQLAPNNLKIDSPSRSNPAYRSRNLTSISLSPSGRYLAVGEVIRGHMQQD